MRRFKNFIAEATEGPSHDVLMGFLHHLSSPMGGDTYGHLYEATVYDAKDNQFANRKISKSLGIIAQGRKEGLDHKTYKDVYKGFAQANHDLAHDDDETLASKGHEARKAYEHFAQSRGFKKGGDLLINNGKTQKSSGEGVSTQGVSLAPHTTSGLAKMDVCPRASKECRANCLGTEAGGNRQFADSALSAKVLKTHFMIAHPHHYIHLLHQEITKHKAEAHADGMKPGVRLNVTSDIPYEKHVPALFHKHPDVQFYDYTKMHQRVMDQTQPHHPTNYHLALSHTGTGHPESNDHHAAAALAAGHVVAMVYQRGKNAVKPTHVEDAKTGMRYPVANGDDDDNTFDRHESVGKRAFRPGHGVASGLQLKGVTNESAGHFANKVDDDGVIRINK